ncbi:hypothetical protein Indivirus_1_206 [Indivirus ILV1]|uniref:OTU domain-containing protein n=1 Tax=Indivirus ILV1 TaxID=1977633 RepID=A0A1V0SCZ0_9VIRU|nr:hypothetical protein Indivirus_1_206 [Indivirus ILV1]
MNASGYRGGRRNGKHSEQTMNGVEWAATIDLQQSTVPGNLTCCFHALLLAVLSAGFINPDWFQSIAELFKTFVRHVYDVDGKVIGYQVRSHLLRDHIADYGKINSSHLSKQDESFFWGEEVEANIRGIISDTRDDPTKRSFLDNANPVFAIFSVIFKCQIMAVPHTISDLTPVSQFGDSGPIIYILGGQGHFDALIPKIMDKMWFCGMTMYLIDDGKPDTDVKSDIEKYYGYLGGLYTTVLGKLQQHHHETKRCRQVHGDAEYARQIAVVDEQINADEELARQLNIQINGSAQ